MSVLSLSPELMMTFKLTQSFILFSCSLFNTFDVNIKRGKKTSIQHASHFVFQIPGMSLTYYDKDCQLAYYKLVLNLP